MTLVTNLRVLGYVFNPASFFLCRDAQGALRVVVVEVHNTTGNGTCTRSGARVDAEGGPFAASMDKAFFVSPFIEHGRPLRGPRPGRRGRPADRDRAAPGRASRC